MLIFDAMRSATTASEVCQLLTLYVETLQFYAVAERLPVAAAALPVAGIDDIEARVVRLREATRGDLACPQGDMHRAIVNEAADVYQEALLRLHAMSPASAMLAAPSADLGTHGYA